MASLKICAYAGCDDERTERSQKLCESNPMCTRGVHLHIPTNEEGTDLIQVAAIFVRFPYPKTMVIVLKHERGQTIFLQASVWTHGLVWKDKSFV